MKIDRFVKVMLVLIAVLLALNCAKDLQLSSNSRGGSSHSSPDSNLASSNLSTGGSSPSLFETSVEAAPPPSFLQVGKTYGGYPPGMQPIEFKVLAIESTGWVKTKAGEREEWVNTNTLVYISAGGLPRF